jgi:hypothetical protein
MSTVMRKEAPACLFITKMIQNRIESEVHDKINADLNRNEGGISDCISILQGQDEELIEYRRMMVGAYVYEKVYEQLSVGLVGTMVLKTGFCGKKDVECQQRRKFREKTMSVLEKGHFSSRVI